MVLSGDRAFLTLLLSAPHSPRFFLGRRFLGRRFLGRCFLGRRFLGRCFLGRRSSFSRSSFSRHPVPPDEKYPCLFMQTNVYGCYVLHIWDTY